MMAFLGSNSTIRMTDADRKQRVRKPHEVVGSMVC